MMEILHDLGAEPRLQSDGKIICKTICHGGDSHKLYYYEQSKTFYCFTRCETPYFDIYELISRVKNISIYDTISYLKRFIYIPNERDEDFYSVEELEDWEIISRWEHNSNSEAQKTTSDLIQYDEKTVQNLPSVRIPEWEKEGITPQALKDFNIKYNPSNESIIIPHYNMDNVLIGIRERTLIKEEEQYGKYKPVIFNGSMYNHPLSLNLFGINKNKQAIKTFKKAILCESEKSVLMYSSYFGQENNICLAICGSNISEYQINMLLSLGVEEIVVALDRQYKELNSEEHLKWVKKLKKIYNKYNNLITVTFILDKKNRLGYKMGPLDAGPEIFLQLFKERIFL